MQTVKDTGEVVSGQGAGGCEERRVRERRARSLTPIASMPAARVACGECEDELRGAPDLLSMLDLAKGREPVAVVVVSGKAYCAHHARARHRELVSRVTSLIRETRAIEEACAKAGHPLNQEDQG